MRRSVAGQSPKWGVPAIGRGAELDRVACEQHLLVRQPHDGVARGVAASDVNDLNFEATHPHTHALVEGEMRPGQAGMLSLPRNKRGKRPISLSMSCCPRSAIIARVASEAMISALA